MKITKMHIGISACLTVVYLFIFLYIRIVWEQIPNVIPMHYNVMGAVDRWGSRTGVLFIPIIGLFVNTVITLVSFFPKSWNISEKIIQRKGRETALRYTRNILLIVQTEITVLFGYLTWITIYAQTLNILFPIILLLIVFGTITIYLIAVYKQKGISNE